MIITVLYENENIKKELKEIGYLNVISVQTIIENL